MKYQVCRALTPIEYAALKADIAENGILVPVEVDEMGEILDGHHRVQAWQELRSEGKDLPTYAKLIRSGMTEEQKRNHARKLNLLRRQMTDEEHKQIMADILRDGGTLEDAAQAAGVGKSTVDRVAKSTFPSGKVERPPKVLGRDGKLRRTKYRSRQPKPPTLFDPGEAVALEPKAAEATAKEHRSEKTEARREERKVRNEELCQEPPALVELPHKFDLIYADPPWRYEFSKTDSREIENQYPTMLLDDICAMPVSDIAIDNAVLFLWATVPKLEEAIRVVNAWGFNYRTAIVWDKVRMGQGIYTRQQVELLLIAIRGQMYAPENEYSKDFRSLVSIERSNRHSEKPEEFYGIIEGLYPDCIKLELFARQSREGWMAWGNQTEKASA